MAELTAQEALASDVDPAEVAARLIAPGSIVDARLGDVVSHSFENAGDTIHKLRWSFVVSLPGSNWDGKEVTGESSTNFTNHPNCKAMNWAMALTGKEFENGEVLNTDDLQGLPCKVLIKHKPDKNGRPWMRVEQVFASAAVSATPPESVF